MVTIGDSHIRYQKSFSTETQVGKNIDKNSAIEGFFIEGMKILIRDNKINVECDGITYNFTIDEFDRRPRGVIERIFNIKRGTF